MISYVFLTFFIGFYKETKAFLGLPRTSWEVLGGLRRSQDFLGRRGAVES